MTDSEKSEVANLFTQFQSYFYDTQFPGITFCDNFCPLAETCEGGLLAEECAEKYIQHITDG